MTSILNWIKRNWLIVTMVAVMIICLPAVFIVVEILNRRTQEAISSRVRTQMNQIEQVERVDISIEPLTPGSPKIDTQRPLNDALLADYERLRHEIKSDAEAVVDRALALNRKHDVLVPGLLPEPPAAMAHLPYEINEAYLEAHRQMLERINAGLPPFPEDVAVQLEEFQRNYRRTTLNTDPGAPISPAEQEMEKEALMKQRLAIYRQHAAEYGVYADSAIQVFNLTVMEQQKPTPVQMYDWQHQTWMHSDVIDAIDRINTSSQGIPRNPVKRILLIEPGILEGPQGRDRPSAAASSSRDSGGRAWSEGAPVGGFEGRSGGFEGRGGGFEGGYPPGEGADFMGAGWEDPVEETDSAVVLSNPDPAEPFKYDQTASMTGRISTGLYDVRNVTMQLIVDSRRIQDVLNSFSQTNFMTVTGVDVATVDVLSHLEQGYFYGQDPVVQLTLQVETIWFRPWTTPLMPKAVKNIVGVAEDDDEADDENDDN